MLYKRSPVYERAVEPWVELLTNTLLLGNYSALGFHNLQRNEEISTAELDFDVDPWVLSGVPLLKILLLLLDEWRKLTLWFGIMTLLLTSSQARQDTSKTFI